jgi:hypothetical protein
MAAPIYTGGPPFIKPYIRTKLNLIPSGTGVGATIVKSKSNGVYLFDLAAGGITYVLPVPVKGLVYTFIWSVAQTSGVNEVITDASGTAFLLGSVFMFSGENVTPSGTLGPAQFNANGTTHVEMETNGTTKGGGAGGQVIFMALSATQWYVTGYLNSPSGTLATPFST